MTCHKLSVRMLRSKIICQLNLESSVVVSMAVEIETVTHNLSVTAVHKDAEIEA